MIIFFIARCFSIFHPVAPRIIVFSWRIRACDFQKVMRPSLALLKCPVVGPVTLFSCRVGEMIRLDWIILPNCKETTTNSIKMRFDESSRTSLTGLSVLMRNAIFIFTLMNPVGWSGKNSALISLIISRTVAGFALAI